MRTDLETHVKTRIARLPSGVAVSGIAASGSRLFWATLSGNPNEGVIQRASLNGQSPTRLVGHLEFVRGLVVVGRYLYWLDQYAIGRVGVSGRPLQRHFIALPQEYGGGLGEGLANDSRYLYISRCQDSSIWRVDPVSMHRRVLIRLPGRSCPQGIAVAGRYVYWTDLHYGSRGAIGRGKIDGTAVEPQWFTIRGNSGPFALAADTIEIYWTWSGMPTTTAGHIGRVASNRSRVTVNFALGDNAPYLAHCRAGECWSASALGTS